MAVTTLLVQQTYEALTPGNIDAQDGYAQVAASPHDLFVEAGSLMDGVNALTFKTGAGGAGLYVEKALTTARVAATCFRAVWRVMVDAGATNGLPTWISWTNGAVVPTTETTTAVAVGVQRNSTSGLVDLAYFDGSGAGTVASAFALGAKVTLRLTIFEGDSYQVDVDTLNTGESWMPLRSGSIVTANAAISRFSYNNNGTAFADATHHYDTVSHVKVAAATKANLGARPTRQATLTNAVEEGDMTRITYSVLDTDTGVSLGAGRSFLIPTNWLSPTDDRSYIARIDQAIADDLKKYDLTQRVATLAASGHQVDF